ncbi:MAG TPA: glycosyltransferase [Candidatus Saccharimonadales bacterium]
MKAANSLRVAIVHDWLVGGGAERVVAELHKMFPGAPIYTSYCSDEWRERLDDKVVTGFLQHWPFGKLRKFVGVLRIWWFKHLDLNEFDLIISSTGNGEAKGIRVRKDAVHVCYCHAPTHYYWRHYDQYVARPGFGVFDPLARVGLKLLVGPLRRWDYKAAQKPDFFLANSTHTAREIKEFYGREATVVFPPIDVERFVIPMPKERHGFVTTGRLVPAKRNDVLVEACTKLNLPLKVIGHVGPDSERLKKLAGPNVTFIEDASDEEVAQHLVSAEAFLFASYDDFGIVTIEALAAGTPVIAFKDGGAEDYVVPGKTGLFFDKQTPESLTKALEEFPKHSFNHNEIRNFAEKFSAAHFQSAVRDFIERSVLYNDN